MTTNQKNTTRFSTFKWIADLNALALFSVLPFAVLLPFAGWVKAATYSVVLGAIALLLALTDDEFRMGYENGIAEVYEDYLEKEAE